jgi:23S rRNA pseudouridine2605 synthase
MLLRFVLAEGRNRQIRKMCEAVGLTVKEIRRIQIGSVRLGTLRSGKYRSLTQKELDGLQLAPGHH